MCLHISSAALVFIRYFFCHLLTQLTSAQEVRASPAGAHSFTCHLTEQFPGKFPLDWHCLRKGELTVKLRFLKVLLIA